MELYKKHRPKSFKEVWGNKEAVKMLVGKLKAKELPQFIMFTGGSGMGKTTLARILKTALKCSDHDFTEMDCADLRGIDNVRDIKSRMTIAPWNGSCRIYLIDESHALTKDAQNAFLKTLEDTPPGVYFFLATTDPNKLLPTIKTRATEVKVKPLSDADMTGLLGYVIEAEGLTVSQDVVERIVEVAEGSGRKALVILEQVIGVEDEEERLNLVYSSEGRQQGIAVARALMKKGNWSEVAKVLKGLDDDPEGVRRLILAYYQTILLSGGKFAPRAAEIIRIFQYNYFDLGKPGLSMNCWEACNS